MEAGQKGARGEPPGAQAPPGRGPSLGRVGRPLGDLAPPTVPPSGLYLPRDVKTLKRGDFKEFCRRSMAETYREEKPSLTVDSIGENTSWKGRSSPSSLPSSGASLRSSSTS